MHRKEKKSTNDWDNQLSSLARQLNRYQPSDELWDKIETSLIAETNKSTTEARDKSHWFERISKFRRYFRTVDARWSGLRIGLAVATVTVLIVVSIFFNYHHLLNIPAANKDQVLAKLDQDIEQTEKHYQKLITKLTKLANQNEQNVEPHLLALYQEKLTLLDESIRECQKALQENYHNPAVQFALFESYREKAATLKLIIQTKSENQSKEVS
jgi:hypothetical protein